MLGQGRKRERRAENLITGIVADVDAEVALRGAGDRILGPIAKPARRGELHRLQAVQLKTLFIAHQAVRVARIEEISSHRNNLESKGHLAISKGYGGAENSSPAPDVLTG